MGCSQAKSDDVAVDVVRQQSSPSVAQTCNKDAGEGIASVTEAGTEVCKTEIAESIVSGQGSSYTENIPLEEVIRPRKKKISRQASGHGGLNFVKQYAGKHDFKKGVPDYILKVFDPAEFRSYQEIESNKDDFGPFVATCCGQMTALDGTSFLKLSNLLATFERGPHVMDCKIGTRSFTEAEVASTKVRQDLYQRAIALDPNFPTKEEAEMQACTKYRWMSFNDQLTTLSDLGFRIDGLTNSRGKLSKSELDRPRSFTEIARFVIEHFLPDIDTLDEECDLDFSMKQVATSVKTQLQHFLQILKASKFVQSHSITGSSLLFAVDAYGPHARVFWIDLAKSEPLPPGIKNTHDSKWVIGNHEDGLFLGVKNMIRLWEEVERLLEEDGTPFRTQV